MGHASGYKVNGPASGPISLGSSVRTQGSWILGF